MIIFFLQPTKGYNLFSQHPFLGLLAPHSLYDYFRFLSADEVYPSVIDFNGKWQDLHFVKKIKGTDLIFVNASLIPDRDQVRKLVSQMSSLTKTNGEWIILSGKNVVALNFSYDKVVGYMEEMGTLEKAIHHRVSSSKNKVVDGRYRLLEHLHQWVVESMKFLESDISHYAKHWGLKKNHRYRNLWQDKDSSIHPSVDIIGEGSIMIHKGVQIRGFTCLEGPIIIKENTTVNPHSYIKHSLIGHTVKVGGEVSSSVISNYSNKAHYGYLGNSYVGEWVNIGAGSITSNLKNNYRTVKYLNKQNEVIDSGETFLGSFLGDFSKIGISTALLPGTIVGMGASVMGTVDGHIPNFSIFNSGKKVGHIKLPAFIEAHKKMFSRRNFHPDLEYWEYLKNIYRESLDND